MFFLTSIFEPLYFLKSCPIFDKLVLPEFSKYKGQKSCFLGPTTTELILVYICIFFFSSDEPTLERIKNILMVMEQRMELRGSAGELLRSAVTPYIQNLSESHFPCHNDKIVDLWKMIIGKNTIEISLW